MFFCILFLCSHLTASVLFIHWGNGNFSALIKVSTEILIICLVKINKILCSFSWRCANSLCFESKKQQQKYREMYGSWFVEDFSIRLPNTLTHSLTHASEDFLFSSFTLLLARGKAIAFWITAREWTRFLLCIEYFQFPRWEWTSTNFISGK